MECKFWDIAIGKNKRAGRSSSILECKYIGKVSNTLTNIVEVAPYWNVNIVSPVNIKFILHVEVAPYWNVNIVSPNDFVADNDVEVAPYWNVNLF